MNRPHMPGSTRGMGERKQITAVFMDVVGFSLIASTADAEDLQHWLEDFYTQSRTIIEAHDGEVTEYLGDGIVALFGLTHADELSAAKAVNAAMTAVREVKTGYKPGTEITLRVGVATGEVAVRASDSDDSLPRATGMVTTLAQRIQEKAEPGTVMIAETTRNLLRGGFSLSERPGQKLKGFAEQQTLFQPMPELRQPETRVPAYFVGRRAELERINSSDHPCLLVGQAGIGKTTLARYVAKSAPAVLHFGANGVHVRASYQPFIDWIMRETGCALPEFSDIQSLFPDLEADTQRALALVLGLPNGQRLLAERTNVALKALIEDSFWQAIRARQSSGLLIFEDLHWLDNASFGVLAHILQDAAAADYQILMTSREDTKIGKYLGNLTLDIIPLDALDDDTAAGMLQALSQGNVADGTRDALVEQAAGVPLFLEQLFKRSQGGDTKIPGSLMDLLAEQIDATGASKPVLQCAAVIGRSFSLNMLRSLADAHEPLDRHLNKACMQGVLEQDDDGHWTFAHALLQQAAYQGLLRRTRIDYHSKLAAHLQAEHPDAVRRNPALLADHLSRAQQHVPAIQNYLAVSQWALFQGALDDAEAHILAALSLCDEAPADVDVTDLEIACYTALGATRTHTQGFTAPTVREAYAAVEKLATSKQEYSSANGPAFLGGFSHAVISADRPSAARFCDLLRDTAANVCAGETNNEVQLASFNARVCLNFYTGDFEQLFAEFSEMQDIYDLSRHGGVISSYGVDFLAACQLFDAPGRAIHGDAHMIPRLIADIDAHQERLNIPVMLPWAQVWGAVPLYYAGLQDQALARLTLGLDTAHQQSATFWQATGAAWLNIMNPDIALTDPGIAAFEQTIKTHEVMGSNIGLPYFRAHYAVALLARGDHDKAYQTALFATRENEATGLWCWYPEVLRLHAGICHDTGRTDEGAKALAQAATIAQKQNAWLWVIRARLDQFRMGRANQSDIAEALAGFDPDAVLPEIIQARDILAAA
ncbi:ATP-binding protein [Loktanella agnita]|uniref:ATP-binding protein n=1 Tax=Loktanella agnita TaxID=287097 RepID=UPI003986F860